MGRKGRHRSPMQRKAKKGAPEFPIGTLAFYGPTADFATKAVGAVVLADGAEPTVLKRWRSELVDVRDDPQIADQIAAFFRRHRVTSIAMTDGLLGCPHEEGIDYPEGEPCPKCPYWADRDRFTGERLP